MGKTKKVKKTPIKKNTSTSTSTKKGVKVTPKKRDNLSRFEMVDLMKKRSYTLDELVKVTRCAENSIKKRLSYSLKRHGFTVNVTEKNGVKHYSATGTRTDIKK